MQKNVEQRATKFRLLKRELLYPTTTRNTLYKLYAVRWGVNSTVHGIQYEKVIQSVRLCHTISTDEAHHQYCGRVCSMVEGMSYRLVTPSVRMCHIFSTVEGVQFGPVKSSVRWMVYNTDQLHHQYG